MSSIQISLRLVNGMLVGKKIVVVCDRLNSGIGGTRESQSIHIFFSFLLFYISRMYPSWCYIYIRTGLFGIVIPGTIRCKFKDFNMTAY